MPSPDKWKTFTQFAQIMRSTIVCVRCGSPLIDHKPAGRLRCPCGTTAHWSPDRFRIVRDRRILNDEELAAFLKSAGPDFASAMDTRLQEEEMKNDGDFYGDIVRSVDKFLDAIAEPRATDKAGKLEEAESAFLELREQIQATLDSAAP